ncbi:MAG: hypothetical protein NZ516_09260 [Raineya sp.]|nr:hypothetical protein [Raineya sp.]
MFENTTLLTQETWNWKLKQVDKNAWKLDLSQPVGYLYGHILLCDNEVLFNNRDGCDNLFRKSN